MNMSYRRAWLLVDSLNRCFRVPVVETQLGGTRGGGAVLTAFGRELITRYRAIERAATEAGAAELAALGVAQATTATDAGKSRRAAVAASPRRRRSASMPRRARSQSLTRRSAMA